MKTLELQTALQKANIKFTEALNFEDSEPLRESLIQRFEYTFELSWKLMSSILKDQHIETYGVKNILREAYRIGLIIDIEKWLKFAEARNLTSHLYKESVAKDVAKTARNNFKESVDLLIKSSTQYLS